MNKGFFFRCLTTFMLAAGLHSVSTAQGMVANVGFTDLVAEPQQLPQITLENVRNDVDRASKIQPGQTREDVLQLLGQPVARTRYENREAWEYQLSLPLQDKRTAIVCQFMVVYSNATLNVEGAYWRRKQCADAVKPAPVATPEPVINISSDLLFGFDQYQLSAAGVRQLTQIAGSILQYNRPVAITVIGYTDRLGAAAYNQTLSERRAETVAKFLVGQGIPQQTVRHEGRGQREQIAACQGVSPLAALKDCLAPNRRVAIQVQPANRN